jgi:hypothetical protein
VTVARDVTYQHHQVAHQRRQRRAARARARQPAAAAARALGRLRLRGPQLAHRREGLGRLERALLDAGRDRVVGARVRAELVGAVAERAEGERVRAHRGRRAARRRAAQRRSQVGAEDARARLALRAVVASAAGHALDERAQPVERGARVARRERDERGDGGVDVGLVALA